MKKIGTILISILLLVSCTTAPIQPSATTTNVVTKTSTVTPTVTPIPTKTPFPTVTLTPALPETLQFTFDSSIPESIQTDIKVAVDQAYWFYVGLGCSPEFHSVNIQTHEVVMAGSAPNGLTWGWNDFFNEPWQHMRITISHEMAHILCQIAITKDDIIPLQPRWLLEGIANYFAEMEQIRFVPSGWGKTIQESEIGMLMSLPQQNFCDFPLNKAEFDTDSGQLINRMPDYPTVGQAAAVYLAKTSPNGIKTLIDFYAYLSEHSRDDAFQMAFGKTKDEFYAEFREKCHAGFSDLAFTPTPIPEGTAEIHGTVTLENGNQNFSDYGITFCISKCPVNAYIQPDGSFSILIPPGPYKISINSVVDGKLIGWYSKQGLVSIKDCADGFNIHPNENLNITISIGTPMPCP